MTFLVRIVVADNVLSHVYRRFLQHEITRWSCAWSKTTLNNVLFRDAGTGGAGGAAAPLALCWEGQGGQRCPLSIKNII